MHSQIYEEPNILMMNFLLGDRGGRPSHFDENFKERGNFIEK